MGADIDWSKAPKWANVVIRAELGSEFWSPYFGPGHPTVQDIKTGKTQYASMTGEHCWTLVEKRPGPVWSGEGLPPVGTVCQLRTVRDPNDAFEGWGKAEILYSSDGAVVWRWQGHTSEFGAEWSEVEFRPIRTPEQIAAEEREKAIDALCYDIVSHYEAPKMSEHYLGLARALHSAGYRKVTP